MAQPQSPTPVDESYEQRRKFHFSIPLLLYLTPPIASRNAKRVAMENARMYGKKPRRTCVNLNHT